MRNWTFYNYFDEVWGGYDWTRFAVTGDLAKIRTDQEADRDGACLRCRFDCSPHFMVTRDYNTYTKLCILDVIRYRPFDFKMSIFGADRSHKQLKLWRR